MQGTTAALHIAGPLRVSANLELGPNKHSWIGLGRFVVIDQPCGTGLGSVESPKDYATSAEEYTEDMIAAMRIVFDKASFLNGGPLIVSGESYGGHYCPHLAAALLKDEAWSKLLRGMIVGNPFVELKSQALTLPVMAAGNGWLSPDNTDKLNRMVGDIADLVDRGDSEAKTLFDKARDWMRAQAGGLYAYDWRRLEAPAMFYKEWLKKPEVVAALHVPGETLGDATPIEEALLQEGIESTAGLFRTVSAQIPTAVYYGIYDTQDSISSSYFWTQNVFGNPAQNVFKSIAGEVIGIEFPFPGGNFTMFNMFGGGHMLGEDAGAPEGNFAMLQAWLARVL